MGNASITILGDSAGKLTLSVQFLQEHGVPEHLEGQPVLCLHVFVDVARSLHSLTLFYTHILQLSCSKKPILQYGWLPVIQGREQSWKHGLALRASRLTSIIPGDVTQA